MNGKEFRRTGVVCCVGIGLVLGALGCGSEDKAKAGAPCFLHIEKRAHGHAERWPKYEPLVLDAGVCMFNKDNETFSMRSLHEAPAQMNDVANRFTAYFEANGFKTGEHGGKPGVITRSYDKDGKSVLVVTHMTTDGKTVDNTVFEYK